MIKEVLMREDQAWRSLGHISPYRTLILEKGEVFKASPFTGYGPRGEPQACWSNAMNLVLKYPDLRYVEGYGIRPSIGLPIMHAFCVTRENKVVDSTWGNPEHSQYMGVVFPTLRAWSFIVKKGYYSILTECAGEMIDIKAIEKFFPEYKGRDWSGEAKQARARFIEDGKGLKITKGSGNA